ncbi:MAG: AAA family ATPase [Saprospiraceae bacterium]|nr:AAA family ATPase [Saprospiraceae bacterium]
MEPNIIGRKQEMAILQEALASKEAEMVAVLGRRRVGKTFLVTSTYQQRIVFELTGIQNSPTKKQLKNFRDVLTIKQGGKLPLEVPEDWLSAFQMLRQYLSTLDSTEKAVVFFDEVPWLAGHRSGFLEALGYFWNSYASRQNLVLVICGSAASWMIRRVVHDKGGLHNRITKRIHLQPFTLTETEAFLQSREVRLDRFQLIQLYMAMGGIPQYLMALKPGLSAMQNIDRICFWDGGLLKDEFQKLYPALFSNSEKHQAIVRALSTKWKGMDRAELLEKIKIASGGGISTHLEELEQSGFITSYYTYGRKQREKVYRLTDPFSLFYLRFIEGSQMDGEGAWMQISQTQAYKSWTGYAFENICLLHLPSIKKAMGISGIYTQASAFYKRSTPEMAGSQVDLVLDRSDHCINLFEIKFHDEPFIPTKEFATSLREKMAVFKAVTKTRKQVFPALIAAFGIKHNQHSIGLVEIVLSIDDLFA